MIGFTFFVFVCILGWAELAYTDFQQFYNVVGEAKKGQQLDPDVGLNISQFLQQYNYSLEYHQVETEDGFILTMHRIPFGRNETNNQAFVSRPVVFFAHGIACSSMDWILLGPSNSLALLLADQGYDIWLGNTRGNIHSLQHKSLSPHNASYWDFSFHEKRYYDTQSSVDYILNITGKEKINYVGHSQGTTQIMVLTSTKPEYNEKFNLIAMLSPIGFMSHASKSPIVKQLAENIDVLEEIIKILQFHGMYYKKFIANILVTFCGENGPMRHFCLDLLQRLVGFDDKEVNWAKFTVFLSNVPSGVAVKEFIHYLQEVNSGHFRNYDYNTTENIRRYGVAEPPSYDVSKITAPLALYYSINDYLGTVEDVDYLIGQMPNAKIVDNYLMDYTKFNHLDFMLAKDVKSILYERVITILNQQNQK